MQASANYEAMVETETWNQGHSQGLLPPFHETSSEQTALQMAFPRSSSELTILFCDR